MDKNKLGLSENDNKLSIEGYEFSLGYLVEKIMVYQDRSQVNLFNKMNADYIIGIMDKETLQDLEKAILDTGKRAIGIIQFIKIFLSIINHNEEETIFLTLGLIDFFKDICESLNMVQEVRFSDITTAICDKVTTQFVDEYKIQTRSYPPQQMFTDQIEGKDNLMKKLDFKAPIVFENNQHNSLIRLQKGKFKTDSTCHNNHSIKQAVFAKEIKKIITLDSLDDKLQMYDLNCNLVSQIDLKSKEDDSKLDIIIFGIAWSEKQQRIGAVLKNFTLSFWDAASEFKFEKNFSVHGYTQDYQASIWYLEKHNMWITTDSKNWLYSWDIPEEKTHFAISTSLQAPIFSVIELPQTDFCAVGSLDKKISLWNFHTQILMFQIEVGQVGVHSIAFSIAFQVLVTAGYENNISLYTIDSEYLDSTMIGKLRGHNSMVNCIQVIEQTPMVVSADDQGIVRLWDIRNQTCIQSYECSSSQSLANTQTKRIHISFILDIFSQGLIGFVGSRINLISFDEKEEIIKSRNQVDKQYPIKVENNTTRDELIVCTRKQVKFFDINTGLCKFTVNGLMENKQDEITAFKQVQQGHKFLLANQKGQISLHSYQNNGQRIKFLNNHTNEVTQLKIDYFNKLLISGGWDSSIKIQKLSDETVEMKRKIDGVHYEKGVSLLEVSVYHNVIFSATQNQERVYVYDYEYGKLLNYIEFSNKAEPTAISTIQGYPVFIVATSDNYLYLIHFTKKDYQVNFDLLAVINIDKSERVFNKTMQKSFQDPEVFITKQQDDEQLEDEAQNEQHSFQYLQKLEREKQKSPKDKKLNIQLNQSLRVSSLNQQQNKMQTYKNMSQLDLQVGQQTQNRLSEQLDQLNIPVQYSIIDSPTITDSNMNNSSNNNSNKKPNIVQIDSDHSIYISKILGEFTFNDKNKMEKAYIYCTNSKGFITVFDLLRIFEQYDKIQYQQHSNTRMNYNAHRNSTEDFKSCMQKFSGQPKLINPQTILDKKWLKQDGCNEQQDIAQLANSLIINMIQAHKDVITSISFVNGDSERIMTSSQDQYIRIWEKSTLYQLCSLNINHPLPIQWQYQSNHQFSSSKKVLFALRILDMINKKYEKENQRKQDGSTKIINFIKKLMGFQGFYSRQSLKQIREVNDTEQIQEEGGENDEQQNQNKKNNLMMSQYYSPRDIKFNEIKEFYKNELLGPSLKRMEINKRVAIAQQLWKKPKLSKEEYEREQAKKKLQFHVKSDERENIINFLDPEYRNSIIKQGYQFEDDYSTYTQNLQNKFEIYEFNAAKKASNKLKSQNSSASQQYNSSNKIHNGPQSGKRQTTQSFQHQQTQQMPPNQTSRQSIMTEVSSTENKNMGSNQNIEGKKEKIIQQKGGLSNKLKGYKSRQTLTIQMDTIKDIPQNYSSTKLSYTQLQSPSVKEPNNFDYLLHKIAQSPKIEKNTVSIFLDSQDTKIRVDAFPQTAAKLQQMLQVNSGCIDSRQHTNVPTSPYNKSGFGIESDYKNKKTQDVYKYAQEKQIIGNFYSPSESVSTMKNNASSIVAASSNKLHSILNGINSKLLKFKRIGNNNSNNQSFPFSDQFTNDKSKQQTNEQDTIQQTEFNPFSQQSSQRSIQNQSKQEKGSKKQILGSNTSSLSQSGFHNSTTYNKPLDLKNFSSHTSSAFHQFKNNTSNHQYFSNQNFSQNRNTLPNIINKSKQ